MYDNFDDFYNETYNNFYNTCEFKDLISSNPIPYKFDETIYGVAEYSKGIVTIKNPSINTYGEIRRLCADLYHELTHYYDDTIFHHIGYSQIDIDVLMLTYSEIHAAYNAMFAFFNLNQLNVKKKIDINKATFEGKKLSEHMKFEIIKETQHMNNVLGFKYIMYFLGEKRAMLKISKDIHTINQEYSYNRIPKLVRTEIINLDKLININNYENIDVQQIIDNKLKAENALRRYSINNIGLSGIESLDNEVRKLLDNLKQ